MKKPGTRKLTTQDLERRVAPATLYVDDGAGSDKPDAPSRKEPMKHDEPKV